MQINFDPSKVLSGLVTANEKYRRAIELYGNTAALKLEAKAKKDAPWTDRTSNARQTIKGVCGWGGVSASITTTGTGEFTPYGEKRKIGEVHNSSMGGTSSIFVIAVTGNMEYFIYLELAHGDRKKIGNQVPNAGIHSVAGYKDLSGNFNSTNAPYAVLWPTVNAMQGEITNGWAKVLNGAR